MTGHQILAHFLQSLLQWGLMSSGSGTSLIKFDSFVLSPEPTVPRPTSWAGTPAVGDDDDDCLPPPPLPPKPPRVHAVTGPTSRAGPSADDGSSLPPGRLCGTCRKEGYNSQSCPQLRISTAWRPLTTQLYFNTLALSGVQRSVIYTHTIEW